MKVLVILSCIASPSAVWAQQPSIDNAHAYSATQHRTNVRVEISSPVLYLQTSYASEGRSDIQAALPISSTDQSALAERIDTLLSKLAAADRFSGSVLVAKEGQVVLSHGYGMANLEYDQPNTPQTKFRIGEITQIFTTLVILQLADQGKVTLDTSICTYIEKCPTAWKPISLHHLLTQMSGIKDVTGAPLSRDFARKSKSSRQIIDSVRESPLLAVPGKVWSYSLVNFVLLGEVVTSVTHQSFAAYLSEHILKPLHMDDTGIDNGTKVLKQRASGYSSKTTSSEYVDMGGLDAALGVYSTVEDLFRLDQAMSGDMLVSRSLLDKMGSPLVHVAAFNTEFGYSWWVMDIFGRRRLDLPSLSIPGFRCTYVRFPKDKVTIIVLTNQELGAGDVGDQITKIVLNL